MPSFNVLLSFCCLFVALAVAEPQKKHGYVRISITEPCVLKIKESTTETQLRSAILMGDVKTAAKILSESNETFSLAAGLTYTDEQQCFLVQSQNPTRDPDVVAIQALALSAERTGETDKLSTAIVTSFQRPCECPLFTPRELDEMRSGFKAILDDPKERRRILEFDGTEEEPDEVSGEEEVRVPAEESRRFVSPEARESREPIIFLNSVEEPTPDVFPETPASPLPFVSPVTPEEPELVESPTAPASPLPFVSPVTPEEPEPVDSPVTTTETHVSSDVSVIDDDDDDSEGDDGDVNDSIYGEDDAEDNGDDEVERHGRRLLVTDASPTNSFVCAHCRPRGGCRPAFWCRR